MVQPDNVKKMQRDISFYAKQLSSYIDKRLLREALRYSQKSERMRVYHSVLRDACCGCFRSVGSGKSMQIYGFNGRIWEVLLPIVFRDAVGDAIISCTGENYVVLRDWNNGDSKMLDSARAGVSASELQLRRSIVGFRNGVWDFADVEHPVYYPFDARMPVVSLLSYDYDPSASCPLWQSFLSMMLPPRDVRTLQKFLGMGCVGRDVGHRIEESLWLVGNGANGKSTIGGVLRGVYGDGSISNMSLGQLLDRSPMSRMLSIVALNGKVFNWSDEADISDLTRGSDAFKKLCSGESQAMRGIGENVSEAKDIPYLIFSMNQMPSNRRMDDAFRRRIVQINFRSSVKEEDMDRELLPKLLGELSGIRNWMLEGYQMLVSDRYQFKHSSQESYMEQNLQYFDIFCKENGLRSSSWAGHREEPVKVLFVVLRSAFVSFCRSRCYDIGSDGEITTRLGRDLRRLGYEGGRSGQGKWYWVYSDKFPDWLTYSHA